MSARIRTSSDFDKLRQLLNEQETFPLNFVHKFIGRNSPQFAVGVQAFEASFPTLQKQSERKSSGDNHIALTYVFVAQNAEEVIGLLRATDLIDDVLVIL